MVGSNVDEYCGRGINYRALDDLFSLNAQRASEVDYTIHVQLLEIYNEQLRDLLVDTGDGPRPRLDIRNTERAGYNVPNATRVRVTCSDDVLHVMAVGQANRASAETKMNERSSRSHSVLTVSVDGLHRLTGEAAHGCLHLIDLAGSERVLKSEAVGERLAEAKHINKSLSALGACWQSLTRKRGWKLGNDVWVCHTVDTQSEYAGRQDVLFRDPLFCVLIPSLLHHEATPAHQAM